jgi:hypothetical protein
MARVFVSHSSKDKPFVRRLAEDLAAMGHEPWLDEWEVKVGECIVTSVEHGITKADCVVLVLTPSAVASGWVDREWKAKYWTEIGEQRTMVLPVLVEECVIPTLLHTRKYADFRKAYAVGFHELAVAIGTPIIRATPPPASTASAPRADIEITTLLAKVHAREIPLASSIAEALRIGSLQNDAALRQFCERELGGYGNLKLDDGAPDFPRYRLVHTFYSVNAQINPHYFGWGDSGRNMIQMMAGDAEHFSQLKTFMPQPISEVERMAERETPKAILQWARRMGDLAPGTSSPEHPVSFYAAGDTFSTIREGCGSPPAKRTRARSIT